MRISLVVAAFVGTNDVVADTAAARELGGAAKGTSRVVTQPAVSGVFRSKGENGEVEFNNFGEGEPVNLTVAPPADDTERALIEQRAQAALDVARALAEDRQVRERTREQRREARLATARAEAQRDAQITQWVAATQPRYYPIFIPRRSSAPRHPPKLTSPDTQSEVGPFRERYRYPWPVRSSR